MPYTPYTLQTLISSSAIEEIIATTSPSDSTASSPPSFFTRRQGPSNVATSPSLLNSRFTNLMSNNITKFTIDAVEAWGNDLYLGTSEGQILHFILEEQKNIQNGIPYCSRLENRIDLGYGKKSVERILVIPQVSKAVVLCDSTLTFYSLPFFDPMPVTFIAPIKGVLCFTHDAAEEGRIGADGTIELCVVKRRVMQIFKLGEFLQLKKEIPLSDGGIFAIRYNRTLCLADVQQYKLINVDLVNTIPLIPTPTEPISSSNTSNILSSNSQVIPKPLAAVVKSDEFLMVSGSPNNHNQTIGIFLDSRGNAIRGTMQWSSYPKSICVEYPYIAALLKNNTIEIHNINNQQLLQVINLREDMEARGMSFGHGIKVYLDQLANRLYRRPWINKPTSSSTTEEESDLQFSLKREVARFSTVPARILVYGSTSVMAQIITPLVMQVDNLIDENRLEEAMEMTDQARNTLSTTNNLHVDRMRCEIDFIYQKCGLLMLKLTVFEDAFNLLLKGNVDPRLVIQLFGDRIYTVHHDNDHPILLFDGLRNLLEQVKSIDDIISSNGVNQSPEQADKSSLGNNEMYHVLLENAKEALQRYLLAERGKRRNILGKGNFMCIAIDTALLKLYIINKDRTMIYQLLKEPNDCNISISKEALIQAKRYYALILFYKSKKMIEELLDLWTKIYQGDLSDQDFNEGLDSIKQVLLEHNHLPLELVMKYIWWVMDQNPKEAVDIIIKSPLSLEMNSDTILKKLKNSEVAKIYLEHLVIERKSKNPEHHTSLACELIKDLQKEIIKKDSELVNLVKEFKQSVNPIEPNITDETFVGFLGRKAKNSQLVQVRLSLLRLLQDSELYDTNEVLECLLVAGPLDIEKAIIYGRLRRYQDALDILIHQLGDFVGAETFALSNGKSTGVIP
ncbi:hypothetical protein BJ944DRAFT_260999 [Cunninghamella echinulata]|nr:hypothetical protein BJ944DRAFT_260999 [Cunninghamella echinulata]